MYKYGRRFGTYEPPKPRKEEDPEWQKFDLLALPLPALRCIIKHLTPDSLPLGGTCEALCKIEAAMPRRVHKMIVYIRRGEENPESDERVHEYYEGHQMTDRWSTFDEYPRLSPHELPWEMRRKYRSFKSVNILNVYSVVDVDSLVALRSFIGKASVRRLRIALGPAHFLDDDRLVQFFASLRGLEDLQLFIIKSEAPLEEEALAKQRRVCLALHSLAPLVSIMINCRVEDANEDRTDDRLVTKDFFEEMVAKFKNFYLRFQCKNVAWEDEWGALAEATKVMATREHWSSFKILLSQCALTQYLAKVVGVRMTSDVCTETVGKKSMYQEDRSRIRFLFESDDDSLEMARYEFDRVDDEAPKRVAYCIFDGRVLTSIQYHGDHGRQEFSLKVERVIDRERHWAFAAPSRVLPMNSEQIVTMVPTYVYALT